MLSIIQEGKFPTNVVAGGSRVIRIVRRMVGVAKPIDAFLIDVLSPYDRPGGRGQPRFFDRQ